MYGSSPYGSAPYGSFPGGGEGPVSVVVNFDDLGDDGRLVLFLNECFNPVADAGSLWRPVART